MTKELHETLNKINKNPKILSVSLFYPIDAPAYAAVQYQDRYKKEYPILIDVSDLHFLESPFSITTVGKYEYVMLKNHKKYLHQVLVPVDKGFDVHYVSENFPTDNRRASLQVVPHVRHLKFHKQQSIKS